MIVICDNNNCRKSYSSKIRLKIHSIIKHHKFLKSWYSGDEELVFCRNPKYCKSFFPEDKDSVSIEITEYDINGMIKEDTYIASHLHNHKFQKHMLLLVVGRKEAIPEGPFLKKFQEKATVITLPVTLGDLQYLKEDIENNVLEFDETETKGIIKVWLAPVKNYQ